MTTNRCPLFVLHDQPRRVIVTLAYKKAIPNRSGSSHSLPPLEGKAVVGETDMLSPMQQDALSLAAKALNSFDVTEPTDITRFIKQEFDRCYGGGWQCIVGTDFGSLVAHCLGCFIHFCVGSLAVLLFRGCECTDEAAMQTDDGHVLEEIIV